MKTVKLSILIATLGERTNRFVALMIELLKQKTDEVEILAYWNNGERPLGEIRQALVDNAKGEYVCFVDDDDRLPEYYVKEILKAIKKKPDYIGWQMQLYHDGQKMKPTYHSLQYKKWHEDDKGYYRDISHLNPIKRNIAKKVSFVVEKGTAEDAPWAQKVRKFVVTEEYIDKPMYFYWHETHESRWRGEGLQHHNHTRPEPLNGNFRYVELV